MKFPSFNMGEKWICQIKKKEKIIVILIFYSVSVIFMLLLSMGIDQLSSGLDVSSSSSDDDSMVVCFALDAILAAKYACVSCCCFSL